MKIKNLIFFFKTIGILLNLKIEHPVNDFTVKNTLMKFIYKLPEVIALVNTENLHNCYEVKIIYKSYVRLTVYQKF